MDEIKEKLCSKCDYRNNGIPITKKKPSCSGLENITKCDILMTTEILKSRVEYKNGQRSVTHFKIGKKNIIDDYKQVSAY